MKIEIKLSANTKLPDVVALNEYIREHNIKGVISIVEEAETTQGSMSFDDYLPAIKLVLGSTATVGGIKGIFDIIKSYFDLVKQKYVSKAETDKENLKQSKVEFTFEESGKKVTLNFSSFDETERKSFFETVNKVLEKDA